MTISDTSFLVTAPMQGSLLYPINPGERVIITYINGPAAFESEAIAGERLKKGDLNYLSMTCSGYVKRNQRRNDFRVDVLIDITTVRAFPANPSLPLPDAEKQKCLINNLSAGGSAFFTNEELSVGEPIHVNIPALVYGTPKTLAAQIHWQRRTENRDLAYKFYTGSRFLFTNTLDKEDLIKFTLEQQRKQLKKEKA